MKILGLAGIFFMMYIGLSKMTSASARWQLQDNSTWIVLLEGMPVSAYRQQLSGGQTLTVDQANQVRGYARQLQTRQNAFVISARQAGLQLEVQRAYTFLLNGLVVDVPVEDAARLAGQPGVRSVTADREVTVRLAESVAIIGADKVWAMHDGGGNSVTGLGMRIAIVDTGVDYTHPDLGGCFGQGCKVMDGYDLYNNDPDPRDDNGHGTHCAGIVAANGGVIGVAPGASLYAYKVLNASGSGTISVIIDGIELAADPDQDPITQDGVDVISMSLGQPGSPDDPWALAVDAAVEQGIVVAVSAGNSGPDYYTVEAPGLARLAIAVGASDKADQIASFSSRGLIPGYDDILKPDLLAPGVEIISTYLDGLYATGSGTSMAAPHVAGAAALIRQLHPDWSPAQVQASLMNSALDLGLDVHTQGAGRLQVKQAASLPGLVLPSSVSFRTMDLAQPLWSDTRLFWLENSTGQSRSYQLSVANALPGSVSTSLEPSSLSLAPGEKRFFSVVFALDTRATPPDLMRNEGRVTIQSEDGGLTVPFAYLVAPLFSESRLLPFGLQTSYSIALADLDGDGDLDAFVGNTDYYDQPANTVWFNDGAGNFIDSGQRLGTAFTWDIALGDLDGDGDLDAFAANSKLDLPQGDEIWLNDGNGFFIDSGQQLGNTLSRAVGLGDLDNDGDLDAFVVTGIPEHGKAEADRVWLNNGQGWFTDSGQSLGNAAGLDVALGDLDQDGDLDAFVTNGDPNKVQNEPDQVWLNSGQAGFVDSGQKLGDSLSQAITLGDLDGDGDLDAFIANGGPAILDGQPDAIWWNDGYAHFTDSGQRLGNQSSYGVALADLHQDGELDAFVAGYQGGNRVWLNDGSGTFTLSGAGFGTESAADVALGDVDRDGDIDALVANALSKPNRLWLNRGSGGPVLAQLGQPGGLTANALTSSTIALAWLDQADGETSYRVDRSWDGNTDWVEIAILPENTQSFIDEDLSCSQAGFYRVRAHQSYPKDPLHPASDGMFSAYSHLASTQTLPCTVHLFLPIMAKSPP